MLHSVVDISSLESYPITFPSFSLYRVVGMPFAREQQEDISSFDDSFWAVGRLEYAFALCQIEQLKFIQRSAFVDIKIVAVSMSLGRVAVVRFYYLISDGADGESPLCISFRGEQIFTCLHRYFVINGSCNLFLLQSY